MVTTPIKKIAKDTAFLLPNEGKARKLGDSLKTLIAKNERPLNLKLCIDIFYDVFSALDHLHQHQIIFQALCSDNIIVYQSKTTMTRAGLTHFDLARYHSFAFKIRDPNTHALAINYYESPEVFWGHINPRNQQIEAIKEGKSHYFQPQLMTTYFSAQSGNHGLRKSFIDYGVNIKKWCAQPNTLSLLNPTPANDMWAAGVLLAECLTGVHPPLLTLETALNHDMHNRYHQAFAPLMEKLLSLDADKRASAHQALQILKDKVFG